jgi:glycosyltransferase involved in cell wall biosynthesis
MPVKICFLSLHSKPYFSQNDKINTASGGGKKLASLGKELSKRDFEIYFITYGNEVDKIKKFDNVNIINAYNIEEAKNLNLFKKIIKILNCFNKTNSDIYIYSNGSPAITALYCLLKRKRYIYWIASDLITDLKDIQNKNQLLTKISNYLDIKLAERVIVQNNLQKNIIKRKFKKRVILLKNPIVVTKTKINLLQKFNNKIMLWVGHFSPIKQPDLFLKIAKELPQYNFFMIGERDLDNPEIYDNIKKESKNLKNLKILGFVSPEEIEKYYQKATILINTSKIEGFPNVFLEAWMNYTPVVSLNVNPDNIINKYKLGFHSKVYEQMIKDINILMKNKKLIEKIGENSRKYVENNHDIKKVTNQFEKLLKKMMSNNHLK